MKEEISNKLNKLTESIGVKKDFINSEADTIQALINPFIALLGYDISDPTQCRREYDEDPRLKKVILVISHFLNLT
ncbi:MAG: hypothetical protein ACRCTJ_01615 [Brevinema sp.]